MRVKDEKDLVQALNSLSDLTEQNLGATCQIKVLDKNDSEWVIDN